MFFVVGIIFTFLVWGEFHYAGVALFVLLTLSSEMLHRVRWRSSITCKGCGFDPVLYKSAPEKAAEAVKQQLEVRKNDPAYMLKPQPKIKPIIRKVKDYRPPSKDLTML